MKFLVKIILSLSLFFYLTPVLAYNNPGKPSGFVNDYASVLTSEQELNLESKLSQFEENTKNEVVVVIIDSLNGDTIENYAVNLFEEWGIGKKDMDNGVLILLAINDKKMRIEVGYGLEGLLTDANASWIIDKVMKPSFKNDNYYVGLNNAVQNIFVFINGQDGQFATSTLSYKYVYSDNTTRSFFSIVTNIIEKIFGFIFIGIFIFSFLMIFVISILRTRKLGGGLGGNHSSSSRSRSSASHRSSHSSSSRSRSSFGGGRSGGGGASGSW